jgi:hypothetical protein
MFRLFSVVLISVLFCNPVLAGKMVVVGSVPSALSSETGPYPKGTSLDGKNVRLKKRQSLKIALCNDKKHTIKGPHKGKVRKKIKCSSLGKRWLETIKRLFRTDRAGDDTRGDEDSLWTIDVSTAANYCLTQDNAILWRPDSSETVDISLTWLDSPSKKVTIKWPADEEMLDWPSVLPLKYDTMYAATMGDQTVNFTVRKLSTEPSDDQQRIIQMMEKNCQPQAVELFNRGEWLYEMEEEDSWK